MNEVTVGSLVVVLGLVGLVAALACRQALHHIAVERSYLLDWQTRLEQREVDLAAYAQAVHEWEGRLLQVAVCGCDPHTLDEPIEGRVRPDRTPPRGPRPGRPPTRRG